MLLYAAVEGQSPFRQDTPLSTLRAIVDEELPPPRRAGPLGPVIEGLLRKDPAERLPADQASRDLRVVGASGSPGADTARTASSYAPTVAALALPPHSGTPEAASAAPIAGRPVTGTPTAVTAPVAPPGRGRRRSAVLLVAGVVLLALALAGLTYALLNRHDGGPEAGGGGAGSPARSAGTDDEGAGGTGRTEDPATSSSSADDGDDADDGNGGGGDGHEGETTPRRSPCPSR